MRRIGPLSIAGFSASAIVVAIGCTMHSAESGAEGLATCPSDILPTFIAHDDSHSETGPHGGRIIELGRAHAYHAELVVAADTGTLIVYILDRDLNELAISETSITLSLLDKDRPQSLQLHSTNETGGSTSEFRTQSASAAAFLQCNAGMGKLHVTIDRRPLVGHILASHDATCDHAHFH